ncbi:MULTISPECIES: hypothetical protein [Bradyrhizobium]|uniref:Uncharacterized protein n=2 Tax=Bradyrhizobium TaxID=374 RepID=A0A9X1RFY3_9BRAD|nr:MULTISPECIES: hypothetical protein [Bradyrhizobium]MCG2631924.1 hypothetical protein [Bradyrhizobium zhengyangense]MCG2644979.1 hypothetical protein [Bradyrhizobium zhengyangense]MCG2672719.1 hypothetical protein [Bradyrhizobium zhengyangense]MDN4985433.1 hypothetical protein [Bradyrhizobium sp. WYCCWR 13022]MDN5002335.1 hypothetical protein [Bradyrhizobium sp. WYCCWR 12677]
MTIETATIPIVRTPKTNGIVPLDLVEAMSVVAASRATLAIIKAYEAAGVTGNVMVPLVTDCPVDPATLGRAIRRVWKAALEDVGNGGSVRVELRPRAVHRFIESEGIPDLGRI